MAFSHLWHQLHLYRKQVSVLALCFLLGTGTDVFGQKMVFQHNLPFHDAKRIHFGLYLGVHAARFKVQHSDSLVNQLAAGQNLAVNSRFYPGFGGGLVLNARLNNYMDLRLLPGVGFYSRITEFKGYPGSEADAPVEQEVSSLYLEVPLMLKYKSERRKNMRVYFVAGGKVGKDLTSGKKAVDDGSLRSTDLDLAIEYGMGLDLYYPFFKFSPELRFSHGLVDMRMPDRNIYNNSLRRMSTHTVTLYFFFES